MDTETKAETTAEAIADVLNNTVDNARDISELAYLFAVLIIGILVVVVVPMLINAWQGRNEKREQRELDREHKETIAKSHEKMSEAVCKLVENDSRSIECQLQVQHQLSRMQERGIVMETVAEECLSIAEREVGSETLAAEISRVRQKLVNRRS